MNLFEYVHPVSWADHLSMLIAQGKRITFYIRRKQNEYHR
jgi:hypothetical protein